MASDSNFEHETLNGDVVFDPGILNHVQQFIKDDISFVAVNNSVVGEEEVKYSVDKEDYISEISKKVENAPGEAVGINFISKSDLDPFIRQLEECDAHDYFEKGLEESINKDGLRILPVDISGFRCIEVDFKEDLENANDLF